MSATDKVQLAIESRQLSAVEVTDPSQRDLAREWLKVQLSTGIEHLFE